MLNHTNFEEKIKASGLELKKIVVETLQINVGKYCNLVCSHCHVGAGPSRKKENMNKRTAISTIPLMEFPNVTTVDITGGAPELNPNFRFLVTESKKRNLHVIDRSNLTVLFVKGQEDLADFLARNKVEIVASLPCYTKENVDRQRGKGVFDLSIKGLKLLNKIGYGKKETSLKLNLVFNSLSPSLPPNQEELEKEYKIRLSHDFGITFNSLYTMTNMPITRFKAYLKANRLYKTYNQLLKDSFNHKVFWHLMCRNILNVSWDGRLYDCDFNQMLGLQMRNGQPLTIFNVDMNKLRNFPILTGSHCFGCTAGSGSSCQGVLS